MSISGLNSQVSLQESQLLALLQQQTASKAKAHGNAAQGQARATDAGQNLPTGTNAQATAAADGSTDTASQNLDADLSPEKISALLLQLQTQQASLDTTMLLGGSSAGPGGKTLVDYLTSNDNVAGSANNLFGNQSNTTATNSGANGGTDGEAEGLSLVDYLE